MPCSGEVSNGRGTFLDKTVVGKGNFKRGIPYRARDFSAECTDGVSD